MVWIAAHERERFAVQVDRSNVRGADDTLTFRAGRPVQHGAAWEMSATSDQRHAGQDFEGLALPGLDAGIGPHHPGGIVAVQMHRRITKGAAPLDHRRIEVGMRNGDRPEAAEAVDEGDGGSVDERDAVPEHIAVGRAQEERALTDGKAWLRANADEARLVLPKAVEMGHAEPVQGRPGLTGWRLELTFILAHPALGRRSGAWCILHSAGCADKGGHLPAPLACSGL